MYLVLSAAPLRDTTVVLVKPTPFSVRVVSEAPAITIAGLTLFTVGAVGALPLGGVLPLREELLPPPQPERRTMKGTTMADKNLLAGEDTFGSKGVPASPPHGEKN